VKIYVAAVVELMKKERHDENWFTTKIGGKTSLVPLNLLCKIFIPGYVSDALLYQNQPFWLPNRQT